MNRFNSLKHIQHFDLHNSNQKMTGKKERKKHCATFWNAYNITKHFEKITSTNTSEALVKIRLQNSCTFIFI